MNGTLVKVIHFDILRSAAIVADRLLYCLYLDRRTNKMKMRSTGKFAILIRMKITFTINIYMDYIQHTNAHIFDLGKTDLSHVDE